MACQPPNHRYTDPTYRKLVMHSRQKARRNHFPNSRCYPPNARCYPSPAPNHRACPKHPSNTTQQHWNWQLLQLWQGAEYNAEYNAGGRHHVAVYHHHFTPPTILPPYSHPPNNLHTTPANPPYHTPIKSPASNYHSAYTWYSP